MFWLSSCLVHTTFQLCLVVQHAIQPGSTLVVLYPKPRFARLPRYVVASIRSPRVRQAPSFPAYGPLKPHVPVNRALDCLADRAFLLPLFSRGGHSLPPPIVNMYHRTSCWERAFNIQGSIVLHALCIRVYMCTVCFECDVLLSSP